VCQLSVLYFSWLISDTLNIQKRFRIEPRMKFCEHNVNYDQCYNAVEGTNLLSIAEFWSNSVEARPMLKTDDLLPKIDIHPEIIVKWNFGVIESIKYLIVLHCVFDWTDNLYWLKHPPQKFSMCSWNLQQYLTHAIGKIFTYQAWYHGSEAVWNNKLYMPC